MTEYNDLTLFEYSNSDWALDKGFPFILHNVGWIGKEIRNNGPPLDADECKSLCYHLGEFIKYPVNLYMGHHVCEICGFTTYNEGHQGPHQGNGEIFVKGINNIVYVAPTLILHYVKDHGYVPPRGFINAVRNVPLMEFYSMFYHIYKLNEYGTGHETWWTRFKKIIGKST